MVHPLVWVRDMESNKTSLQHTLGIHWAYTGHTLGIHWAYTGHTLGIHWPQVIRNEELWERTEQEQINIQIRRLRKILKIYWPEKISNMEVWARTGQGCVLQEIARCKWNWIGHTLRKPTSDITRQALEWNPQGKRKVGRPVKTWRRSVEEELKQANITWNAAKRTAANRVR